MRIRDLNIDGFGVWAGLRLGPIGDGLNLFYGPNEAGKTTLLQFLRTALYGMTPERRARYLPPVHSTRAGGSITLDGAEGPLTLRRRFFLHGDAMADSLVLAGPDGIPRDERVLPGLLGHVDEAVYRNVFAVGLREIQELGSLSDTAAAERLYKLATGLDRVSLVDVLHELAAARERIVSGGGANATFNQLLPQRDRLRRQSLDAQPSRQYVELIRQRYELAAQISAQETEAAELERAARIAEIATSIHGKWHDRRAAEAELAAIGAPVGEEQQTLDRYAELAKLVRRGKRKVIVCTRKLAENRREIDALGFDPAIFRHQARVESLLDQEQWATTLDADRGALEERVALGEIELGRLSAELGIDVNRNISASETTDDAWQQLQAIARAMREAHKRLDEATEAAAKIAKSAQDAQGKLGAALSARSGEEVTSLMERTGKLVAQLRRRVQLEQRIDEMSRRKSELEAQSHDLLARQLLPGWALVALGIAFVVGVVAVLAGLLLGGYMPGGSGRMIAVLGGLAAGGAAVTKFAVERAFAARSDACLAQLDTLAGQLEDARDECAELDETLPSGGGPLITRLQAAEKELAAVDALAPLEASRHASAQSAEAADALRAQAEESYRRQRQKWRQALVDAGLPRDTQPAKVKQLVQGRGDHAALARRQVAERAELARRHSVVEAFHLRLSQLQADLDLPLAGQGLTEQFHALRDHLRSQAELAGRRSALIRVGRRLRRTRLKIRSKVDRARRRLHLLLDRAGVRDGAELRRRALQSARREQLINQRDTLSLEIAAMLGPNAHEADFDAHVADQTRAQLDDRWLDLSSRAQKLREQIKASHEQIGRSHQQTQALVEDPRRGETELRLASIERQLRDAAGRWRVLATTEWFLTGVRATYERERQPETLRAASRYMARLTEGRYLRVWTPLDQDVLRVDDASGRSLPVEVLSRGTREQLFLSLRLALVESYRRRGVELPMILDDVLVNFDAGRTHAAATVLGEFAAEGHQLLIFTCHEHIYRMFKSLGLSARELPHNPSRAAIAPPMEPAFEIEVEPEPIPPVVEPIIEPVVILPPPLPAPPPPEPITFRWIDLPPEPMQVITPVVAYAQPPVITMEVTEEPTIEPVAPPAPPAPLAQPTNGKSTSRRTTIKFDPVHVPRGPFATAVWYLRVADEIARVSTEDFEDDPEPEPPRPRKRPPRTDDPWMDFEPADEN